MTPAAAPTFTVVMPAYNAADTVGSAIRSVLGQTRQDFEIVVVDDGSTDGTAARVEEFLGPRVRLLRQENRGPAAARNAGLGAARGRLMSMLDADDLWLPRYLEAMAGALDAAPDAGMAYTDAWLLEWDTRQVRVASAMSGQSPPDPPPASAREMLDVLLWRNFIYNSVTLRREVVERVGGPDERLQALVDWEWWLRIAAHGVRAVRPPGRLCVYRPHNASISRNHVRVARNHAAMYRLVADEYDLPEEVRARLRRHAERYDAEVDLLEGRRPLAARLRRVRRRAGRVKRFVLRREERRCKVPPRELVDALGDLRHV